MIGGLRRSLAMVLVLAIGIAIGSFVSETAARFSATTQNSGNSFTSDNDWTPPSVAATAIGKQAGGATGYIKSAGSYYVYAQVVDGGNPASGISTVRANTSSFDSGVTAATLSAGSYSVEGVSYNYRSALLTASATTAGTYSYSITSTDNETRSQVQSGYTVVMDTTVPAASNIDMANGSGTLGQPDVGDVITLTYSEQLDAASILSGWGGSQVNVIVHMIDNGGSDYFEIWNAADTTMYAFGLVNSKVDALAADVKFGLTGTPSTIVQSGATITITLGTINTPGNLKTPVTTAKDAELTPTATQTDRAGNAADTGRLTEPDADPNL